MKKNNEKISNKFIYALLIVIVLLSLSVSYMNGNSVTKLSYDKFVKMAENKEIKDVSINLKDSTFTATDTNKQRYTVDNPKYDNFKKDLLEYGIDVKEDNSSNYTSIIFNLLQLGFMIFIGYNFYQMIKGQTNSGSNEVAIAKDGQTITDSKGKKVIKRTTFEDVAGLKQVKDDLVLLVDFLKNPKRFNEAG